MGRQRNTGLVAAGATECGVAGDHRRGTEGETREMTTKLWNHQRVGAEWLQARSRAYLGDRPRVGKTLTLATAAKEVRAKHVMVVCPAIVRTHWRETFGATNYAGKLSVCSYSAIVNGGEAMRQGLLGPGAPDVLILDEAHALKTMTSQRTRLVLGREGYARRIPIVWAASGTPVPRHPGEMYAILSTMFPRVLAARGIRCSANFESRFLV